MGKAFLAATMAAFVFMLALSPAAGGQNAPSARDGQKSQPLAAAQPAAPKASGIQWTDWDDAGKRAISENKFIFVNFYTDWCSFCRKLTKTTFKDPQVIGYLNQNFISVKVNGDKNRRLTREFKVRGYPTLAFVSPDGKPISVIPGYAAPAGFLSATKYINTGAYKNMTFAEFKKQK